MDKLMEKLSGVYDGYMLLLVIFVGLFLLFRDVPTLEKRGLMRDVKIAKTLGYIYLLGGSILFIVVKMF